MPSSDANRTLDGKAFKLTMITVGRWNAQGTMDEDYLFWDNATYMKQIGVGQ